MSKFKIFVLITVLFFQAALIARVVNEDEAITVSLKLIQLENQVAELRLTKDTFSFKGITPLVYQGEHIGYIVHLLPQGFMIFPGITELSPCKFVCFSGNFEEIKDHPFIRQVIERIDYTRARLNLREDSKFAAANSEEDPIDTIRSARNEGIWEKYLLDEVPHDQLSKPASLDFVPPMLTSKWNQETPYNMYTPTIFGYPTPTGCAATAQAQVMYYWKYPTYGQGSHSYTWWYLFDDTWYSQDLNADFDHEYYWDRMVDEYDGTQTAQQEDAVARLMSDVGISLDMYYGLGGSGVSELNCNDSLQNFFKYSPDVQIESIMDYYTWDDWFDMFKQQMDKGWPAMLATFVPDSYDGHAIVVDGYRTLPVNEVHVNLGWGGYADGYYSIDDIYGYGDFWNDSAVINIHPPDGIIVTSPNGGEKWTAGAAHRIKWTSTGSVGNVKIEYSTDNGSKWSTVTASTANDGIYNWILPNVSSNQCLVWISDVSDSSISDISDNVFSILPPKLTITSPNGGEFWQVGSIQGITWTTTGFVGDVKIEFSADNGSSWTTVTASTANDGTYSWTLPNVSSGQCLLRISEASDGIPSDTCDDVFSIFFPTLAVTSPNGGEGWEMGSTHDITWTTTGSVGDVKIEFSANNGSSWSTVISSTANNGVYSWKVPDIESSACLIRISEALYGSPVDTSDAVFTVFDPIPPEIALSRSKLNFAALSPETFTGSQVLWLNNSGGGTLNWSTGSDTPWLSCTPGSGTNVGVLTVSVNPAGLTTGAYTGTITVTAPNASNSPQTVTVNLTVKGASQGQLPFGTFSTPVSGSTVCGSIPVTGWVLDDIEVKSVKIYNGTNYVGDAVFVEGARPDVEQAYPGYPKNYQAGWGYMLLTNCLPNGGNGTYTLYAKAVDSEGNQVTLGTKIINCDNANAVKPFGTLDTPPQGGSASGASYVNWGWVLTPQPNHIPTDGSTINVFVDGVNIGHPTYNISRDDIAKLFPGYANSNGPAGYFYLDTTQYTNGVHTIQWTATDDAGNTDGIGSRYFTVSNSAASESQFKMISTPSQGVDIHDISQLPEDFSGVRVTRGFKKDTVTPDVLADGLNRIVIHELERIEVRLIDQSSNSKTYSGYMVLNNRLLALPVGSTFDAERGMFYWQPGPGFLGRYHLVFVETSPNGTMTKKNIMVEIVPKTAGR